MIRVQYAIHGEVYDEGSVGFNPLLDPVGGQGAAGHPKLRVERQPFLASKVVVFGVNSTGVLIFYM
jgi:hypothetical protein